MRGVDTVHHDGSNGAHGHQRQQVTMAGIRRHEAEDGVGQGQAEQQAEQRPCAGLRDGAVVHVLIEARGGIDDEHAARQRQAMGGGEGQHGLGGFALAQHDGNDGENDQAEIEKDLEQCLLVQVMVEYSNHLYPRSLPLGAFASAIR